MDLQRADARRQVQDTAECPGARQMLQRLHQRVRAKAQIQVELQRPILDQQILVARLPVYHLYLSPALRSKVQDRVAAPWRWRPRRGNIDLGAGAAASADLRSRIILSCRFSCVERLLYRYRAESNAIARLELPHLP